MVRRADDASLPEEAAERTGPLRGLADSPWAPTAAAWAARCARIRFVLLLPLALALLLGVARGAIGSASVVFATMLAAALLQGAVHVAGSRIERADGKLARARLALALLIDVLFLAALAREIGDRLAAPLLLIPCVAAALSLATIPAAVLIGIAALAVVALGFDAGAPLPAAVLASALAGSGAALIWYRRRVRFLEARVRDALRERETAERRAEELDHARRDEMHRMQRPATPPTAGAPGAVAEALSGELLEPAGVVRARAESLRFALRTAGRGGEMLRELERVLQAVDRLEDVRLTLAVLSGVAAQQDSATDVRALALELRDALAREAERDGVRLRIEAPRSLPRVCASHNEVRLVLVRLVDAARRAALRSGRTSRVTARFEGAGAAVVLSIEDQLPPPESDADLFDPGLASERRPALGLALAVARIIAERRGGGVEVAPRAHGLLVRVSFARAVERKPAPRPLKLGVGE